MANKDILQITFDAESGLKDLEKQLLSSMDEISGEASQKLTEAFTKAGRDPKVKKQLTGIYQGLFDDLAEASGEIDSVNKAIDRFAGRIEYVQKVARKKDIKGLFDNLSIGDVDKILKYYDKIAEKEAEINRLSSDDFRSKAKEKTAIKSLQELEKVYGSTAESKKKYEEQLSTYAQNAGVNVSAISKEIEAYSTLVDLFEKVNSTKVSIGSEDSIKKQQALLYVMNQIQELESGSILFSKFRTKELIDVKGLQVPVATLTQQLEASVTSMVNSLTKTLNSEIAQMYKAAGDEAVKLSNHQAKIAAKTQAKVESALGQPSGGTGAGKDKGSGVDEYDYDEHNNIFAKYFDTAKKSAEELEDLFAEVEDNLDKLYQKGEQGELSTKELKEYVTLYEQLENLTSKIDGYEIHPDYNDYLKTLLDSDDRLENYAKQLEKIRKEGYVQSSATGAAITTNEDESKIEEIKKEITEVKEDLSSLKGRVDTLEDTTAFEALSSQVQGFDERIKNVDGSIDNLVDSFKLLSQLSLTDLQKVVIPLFNGINQLYDEKKGNQISVYWEQLKEGVEGSNAELKELLKLVGLFNSSKNGLNIISDGMENSGGLIGDDKVLIARKNKRHQFEEKTALKAKLDEAYKSGINVARILDIIGTKESKVFFDIQEKASGNILGNIYGQNDVDIVNPEWFEATDEQIKKLISDMITLQKMGVNVESNLTNIMYDKAKGFSFIDMDLGITKFENDAELMEDHMMRIFGDLEDFYLDKQDTVNLNLVQQLRSRFENLSEQVQQAYAEAQDSHSPSKEFEKLENDAVDGIAKGAKENEDRLKNIGEQMADNVKEGFKEGMSEIGTTTLSPNNQTEVLSNQTPLSLVEESSGQMALFEGVEEQQKKIVESVKETNQAVEGQIDLFQYLASIEQKDTVSEIKSETSAIEENTKALEQNVKAQENGTNIEKQETNLRKRLTEIFNDVHELQRILKSLNNGSAFSLDLAKDGAYGRIKSLKSVLEEYGYVIKDAYENTDSLSFSGSIVSKEEVHSLVNGIDLLKDLNKQYSYLSSQTLVDKKVPDYLNQLQVLKDKITEISNFVPIDITDEDKIAELKTLENGVEGILDDLKDSQKYDLADLTKINKLSGRISDTLRKNTAMPKNIRESLEGLRETLKQTNLSKQAVKSLEDQFISLTAQMKATGKVGASMGDKIKKKFSDVAAYFATYVSIQDFIQMLRRSFEIIKEYDDALTEMRKVTDESVKSLKEYQKASFDVANTVGTTATALQKSTADFLRIGESLEQAAASAQTATVLLNVSEFESIDQATDSLVSMSAAFKELGKGEIVDVVNQLGNNFAISTDGLATALQNSASALKTAQNDFFEAAALTTAANTVTQDPDKVGAGLRTIALRLTGTEAAREELAEMGEEIDDFIVTTTSNMDQKIKDLTKTQDKMGVSLLDMNGNYRSTYEVLLDIAKVWDTIAKEDLATGENRQNALLEMMAGEFLPEICGNTFYRTHLTALIA